MNEGNANIHNTEIFSLFQTEQEISNLAKHLNDKVFGKIPNKQRYELFERAYGSQCSSPLLCKFLYCSYILDCLYSGNAPQIPVPNENPNIHPLRTYMDTLTVCPFDIISSFYTLEYLLNKHKFYQYKDFDSLSKSDNHYEQSFTMNGNIYYDVICNGANAENQKNSTRGIREAHTNIFHLLVNYTHGEHNPKNVNTYYINAFLFDVSLQLAMMMKRKTFESHNFADSLNMEIYSGNINSLLGKKIDDLFQSYFTLIDKLYIPENLLHNVLTLYKLEYGFGILSLAFTLGQINLWNIICPSNNNQTQKMITDILPPLQCDPAIYATPRYGLLPSYQNNYEDIDVKTSIIIAKRTLAILYDLYDNSLVALHQDLAKEIETQYSAIARNPLFLANPTQSIFPNNGWYMMYVLFETLFSSDKTNRNDLVTYIKALIKILPEEDKKHFATYLAKRYNPDWFTNIKKLFENPSAH